MHWLNANINHLTAPLGMLLGLFAVVSILVVRSKRRRGHAAPYVSERYRIGIFVMLLLCAVLLGVALVKSGLIS